MAPQSLGLCPSVEPESPGPAHTLPIILLPLQDPHLEEFSPYLFPLPRHPLLQLPTRQSRPWDVQPGCRKGLA